MKTIDAAFLSRLGLSLAGAAQLHGIRVDTVKNWSVGRRTVTAGAWDELRAYEAQIVDRAEAMRELWEENPSNIRSEEHTSELQSLMRISYSVFCLKKKNPKKKKNQTIC